MAQAAPIADATEGDPHGRGAQPADQRGELQIRRYAWRSLRQPSAAVVATLVGVLGLLLRVLLTAADYPMTDSDEAAMGLAAFHIGRWHELPVFMYGQHYMGTAQAYLAAPGLTLFGPSVALLRLPTLVCFALFLVAMYLLTSRLYTPWFAVVVVAALSAGSDRVLNDELIAHGGSTELKAAAALLLLTAVWLATGAGRYRPAAYLSWGLVAGFALWDHLVVAPYVAVAGGVLLVCCTRELAGRMGLLLTLGVIVGAGPLLAYNLSAESGEDSLSVFVRLTEGPPTDVAARLSGGLLTGVPMSTGMCNPGACTIWQQTWAPVYLMLLGASAWLAVNALRRQPAGAQERARHWSRLALTLAAFLTIASYANSAPAALWPTESVRYLSCLLVSTPAALWPLWWALRHSRRAATVAMVTVGVAMFAATGAAVISAAPAAQTFARDQRSLLDALYADGVRHMYSEYWTCNRLTFASGERITCAVLNENLQPGFDRYEPYRAAVEADPQSAYAFPSDTAIDRRFREQLRRQGRPDTPRATAGDYNLYLPSP